MKQVILNSVQELTPYLKELKKIRIWVCNTASGKSYLSSIDDRFYDLDSYRSQLHHSGVEDFEEQIIPKLKEKLNEGKIILNAAHTHFLKYLEENNIPFVYMYGKPEVQAEYMERMRHRGSSEQFIEKYGTVIAEQYSSRARDKRGTFKIEMNPGEYISDYIWKVYEMPPKYIGNHKFNSEQIKMVFIDLDGTLLDKESKVSDLTKKTIERLKDRVKIVINTGRGIDTVSAFLKELKLDNRESFVTYCNGALITRGNGEIIAEKRIPKSSIEYLLKTLDPALLPLCILRTVNSKFYINDIKDMQKFLSDNKVYKIMIKRSNNEGRACCIKIQPPVKEAV